MMETTTARDNPALTSQPEVDDLAMISPELVDLFALINNGVLSTILCILGVSFNVVNMIVFIKQGFKDYVNISLLALSAADLVSLSTQLWISFNINPLMPKIAPHWYALLYLSSSWPHVISIRVISLLIVFITLERFLCISLPLKIKSIITHRRTILIIVSIFVFAILTVVPIYTACYIGPIIDSNTNTTTQVIIYTENGVGIESVTVSFGVFVQLLSFGLVVVFTVGLVKKLVQTTKWREKLSSVSKHEQISKRDKGTGRMIILISTIYIICYFPFCLGSLAMVVYKDFGVNGKYRHFFNIASCFMFTLDCINSSVSIFVYLNMSTRYRENFNHIFKLTSKCGTKINLK